MTKVQQTSAGSLNVASGSADEPTLIKPRRGRPPGSKNKPRIDGLTASEALALETSRKAVLPGSDVSRIEAVNMAQVKSAVKGGSNAQWRHLDRIGKLEQKREDAIQKSLEIWECYVQQKEALLEDASPELREKLERTMLPHHDDVHVDWEARTVRFTGPVTSLDRREWNAIKDDMEDLVSEVTMIQLYIWAYPSELGWQALYLEYMNKISQTFLIFTPRHWPRLPHPWHELPNFDCEFHEHFVNLEGMDWDEVADYLGSRGFPNVIPNSGLARARARGASSSTGLH